MQIVLAWSAEGGPAREITLDLPEGARAVDALRVGAERADGPGAAASRSDAPLAVWGRVCATDAVLQPGDRLEIHRPLMLSAGDARRRRAGRPASSRR